jgi:apolipoprotein N-acyltransferase
LGVWRPDSSPLFENKVLAIDAMGEVAWQYHKAHPVIGAESSFIAAGGGSVRSVDAEFGRIGAVICHDLDFPPLLRQASANRIGLVVAPSADWSVIATLHARMAVLRAVENGFNLLRPTANGRSLAVDTRGRIIARLDFAADAMVAYVPAESTRTVYGMVGDLFAWLCLAVLVLWVIIRRGRTADSTRTVPESGFVANK